MYRQSLPPAPTSPNVAAVWARGIAQTHLPIMTESTGDLARQLVTQAIDRTPPGEQVQAEITITGDSLRIDVRAPGEPGPRSGAAWAEISQLTPWFGTTHGPDGHLAWAELRGTA